MNFPRILMKKETFIHQTSTLNDEKFYTKIKWLVIISISQCKKLLRHLDSIIEAREEKKSPEEICDLLKLCEKNVPVMKIFQGVVEGLKDLFADW